jgi:hypothetical protein
MIQKLMVGTIVFGLAGLTAGMATSTFNHYYRKYADFEDLKLTGVQEVTFVGDHEVME